MRVITPVAKVLLFLVFAVSVSGGYAQVLTVEVPLSRQLGNADLVIEGKVVDKKAFWDEAGANIYTLHTIEVYKVFKGDSNNTILVITPGGTVGLESEAVFPSLHLNSNDIGLFILKESDLGIAPELALPKYTSYSDIQGYFQYDFLENRASNPYRQVNGIVSTFYNLITGFTGRAYTEVSYFDVAEKVEQNVGGLPENLLAITSFSPSTASAGTKTILTISGSGFGTSKGVIKFKDPDSGGSTTYAALSTQILNWSNSQIKVEIPTNAGTGKFIIETASGLILDSTGVLTIEYAESTIISDAVTAGINIAYPNQHVSKDIGGGYVFTLNDDFVANMQALGAFTRALNSWVCETGMNWSIGGNTSTDVTAADGINLVRFDNGNELPDGVLGRCTTRSSGCYINDGTSVKWYVKELDMRFDDTASFNYDLDPPAFLDFDFESIALHELGHGHLLGHVIDTDEVMNYSISNGEMNRDLSLFDVSGGTDIHSRSITIQVCDELIMTNATCNTAAVEQQLTESVHIYPNPSGGVIYIENPDGILLMKANVYDVGGRLMIQVPIAENTLTELNLGNLSKGVYILELLTANSSMVRKVVLH